MIFYNTNSFWYTGITWAALFWCTISCRHEQTCTRGALLEVSGEWDPPSCRRSWEREREMREEDPHLHSSATQHQLLRLWVQNVPHTHIHTHMTFLRSVCIWGLTVRTHCDKGGLLLKTSNPLKLHFPLEVAQPPLQKSSQFYLHNTIHNALFQIQECPTLHNVLIKVTFKKNSKHGDKEWKTSEFSHHLLLSCHSGYDICSTAERYYILI